MMISLIKSSQRTKHIDKTKINLGSEKRNVVPNGKFDRKYQIIVPNNFINI
ncbi:type IV toxin-antitoxin system AbiEi family antitoxin domain-containing protein [Gilliamella apicola]|uniref:type IV toxin-antitoxin system AbiEi family antitoxin domain-containing protein n=1 Tax=Gilliamella apicola TaxID=1196095 RepID=UPI00117B2AAC|nr:type IV toxin-antitoxin system AbiEi family antitoxin domain-containing protein [Gilliamella apicola]